MVRAREATGRVASSLGGVQLAATLSAAAVGCPARARGQSSRSDSPQRARRTRQSRWWSGEDRHPAGARWPRRPPPLPRNIRGRLARCEGWQLTGRWLVHARRAGATLARPVAWPESADGDDGLCPRKEASHRLGV